MPQSSTPTSIRRVRLGLEKPRTSAIARRKRVRPKRGMAAPAAPSVPVAQPVDHLPGWEDLAAPDNQIATSARKRLNTFLATVSTARFGFLILLVAGMFTVYVGHVHATQDVLAAVQDLRRENQRLHLQHNRLKGAFDRRTGPGVIYQRAHVLGLHEGYVYGPTIIIDDKGTGDTLTPVKAKDQILSRMYMVLAMLGIIPLFVVGQMLRIYLYDGAALREQGMNQVSSYQTISAMRGAVLDRSGRLLAVNTVRYHLALDPTVASFDEHATPFYTRLAEMTGKSATAYERSVANRASRQYVELVRGISETEKELIASWDVPGVIFNAVFTRRYNYGPSMAHVLGHVDTDGKGLAGLEKQYNAVLTGTDGRRVLKRDRRGVRKPFVGGEVIAPEHGQNLVLTIDLIQQAILEDELARGVAESGARWGTGIAMDPHTGAILALANVPTYDPNQPGLYPIDARRNHAITDRIEPGSTFKLVTAVAAIEQDVVKMTDSIETGDGWTVFHGRTMQDTRAHGTITFAQAIAHSSNVGVAKTAVGIDEGVFYQYARNLGFGQSTWIDLPGEIGGRLKKPVEWSGTTLTSMSIGYEVNVTPLQILAAYSALANGGLLVKPYIVAERHNLTGQPVWIARQDSVRRAFSAQTAQTLLPAFKDVVTYGSAKQAQVDHLSIAGKTGTALKVLDGFYSDASRASFVGFFPAEDPVVALLIVLDEPTTSQYGGVVAAPVFQRVAQRWMGTFPETIQHQAPPVDLDKKPIPDVRHQPAGVAATRLLAAGYDVTPPEADDAHLPVTRQRPLASTPLRPGDRVRLSVNETVVDTSDAMPDLRGLSARQAIFWLASRGVQVKIEGSGMVAQQTPRSGAPLASHAVLQCR